MEVILECYIHSMYYILDFLIISKFNTKIKSSQSINSKN